MKSDKVWFRVEWSKTRFEQADRDRSGQRRGLNKLIGIGVAAHQPKLWLINFPQEHKNKLT